MFCQYGPALLEVSACHLGLCGDCGNCCCHHVLFPSGGVPPILLSSGGECPILHWTDF